MGWGSIPDRSIRNVLDGLKNGKINPEMKTYVFKLKDGRTLGVDAVNEDQARYYCETRDHVVVDLVDIEVLTINGMTIDEIKIEARNRGIV
jgi:hypothetical protein